jgi:hypothetical protein
MRLAGVRAGDLVLCDVRGARFHAEVTACDENGLAVRPLQRAITYRHVRSRQAIAHWRKAGRSNPPPAAAAADPPAKEGTRP